MVDAATFSFFPLGTLLPTPASEPIRAACASLGRIPLPSFSALCAAAAARVAGGGGAPSGDALERHPALSQAGAPVSGTECLRALLALLVDFSRCGVAPPAARGAVEDGGLPAAHAAAFCDAYGAALAGMRAALNASSLTPPRLVDVAWRLDFLISSKELGRVARPVYRVCFTLEEAGAPSPRRAVEVACSPQELEDLLESMKGALRAAEGAVAR